MEILKWLESWYQSQCDGDWEHEYGISIGNIDNPGWSIKINLTHTDLEDLIIDYQLVEKNKNDWYGFSIKDENFDAAGDPTKLRFLLEKFKEIVEKQG